MLSCPMYAESHGRRACRSTRCRYHRVRRWTAKVCRKCLGAGTHLWSFAEVEGVAPDNNAAERALRHGVIWRKLSLGTASEGGSRFVEGLLSVIETCRQRGRNIPTYLAACFQAK